MIERYQELLNECIDIQENRQILEIFKDTNKLMKGNMIMLKNLGKHSTESHLTKQLQLEIETLKQTVKLKDREIEDVKTECAGQFRKIRDLCFCNEYDDKLDKRKKLCKIEEIASDNFSALVENLATNKKAKIIKLSNTDQSNR